ncbi:MAG: UDP-glucose 4-epimerase [Planctomycetaceae bacterium]|nr:UDP-glucose 4-epimerase [Planctomycetaceae bacterium]
MRESILVTGGAGYIGSHMVLMLAEHGFDVVTLDNLSRGFQDAVVAGEFVAGDLTDAAVLDEVLGSRKFAAVLHFAALAYVGESIEHPDLYYRNNLLGSINLFDAMRRHGVENCIFSSTCSTFGEPLYVPIDEVHPQHPISPYGRSKWMVEQVLADYGTALGMRSIILRYFNAAGADPAGRIGNRSVPQARLIPLVIQAASGRNPHVSVFGRDYPTPDGTCIRDYIHVTDLCHAHLLALLRVLEHAPSTTYNLSSGQGVSVQDVIAVAEEITGRPIPVVDGPRRAGDPAALVGDSRRAQSELGWEPKYSDLRTIIAHEWMWEQQLCRSLDM